MPNELIARLDEWINRTFNDFYLCTDMESKDWAMVHHLPTTPNSQFMLLIKKLYRQRDFNNASYIMSPGAFCLKFPDGDVMIQPYEDQIYHTEYVKED